MSASCRGKGAHVWIMRQLLAPRLSKLCVFLSNLPAVTWQKGVQHHAHGRRAPPKGPVELSALTPSREVIICPSASLPLPPERPICILVYKFNTIFIFQNTLVDLKGILIPRASLSSATTKPSSPFGAYRRSVQSYNIVLK